VRPLVLDIPHAASHSHTNLPGTLHPGWRSKASWMMCHSLSSLHAPSNRISYHGICRSTSTRHRYTQANQSSLSNIIKDYAASSFQTSFPRSLSSPIHPTGQQKRLLRRQSSLARRNRRHHSRLKATDHAAMPVIPLLRVRAPDLASTRFKQPAPRLLSHQRVVEMVLSARHALANALAIFRFAQFRARCWRTLAPSPHETPATAVADSSDSSCESAAASTTSDP
jgi:hypothetical protein